MTELCAAVFFVVAGGFIVCAMVEDVRRVQAISAWHVLTALYGGWFFLVGVWGIFYCLFKG